MKKRELNPALLSLFASKKQNSVIRELKQLYLDSLAHRMQDTPKEYDPPKRSGK